MSETEALTIMFQAPNGVGLGHISRLAAIALALRDLDSKLRLSFVLEGGSHELLERDGFPYVSLPHFESLRSSGWDAWSERERIQLVTDLSSALISRMSPALVVTDSFPCFPFLTAVALATVPIVLCARKTKDESEYFREVGRYRSLLKAILIPHNPGEVAVPKELEPLVHYTGTIVRPVHSDTRVPALSGRLCILITGGGGGYPQTADFYNMAMEAVARYRQIEPDTTCVLMTGPLFKQWWDLRIPDGIRIIPFEPNFREMAAKADLVICQAGYNTISEMQLLGTPCISVPAERYFDDQFARAEEAAKSLSHFQVYLEKDAGRLAELIAHSIASPRPAARLASSISGSGARCAAELLLRLVGR